MLTYYIATGLSETDIDAAYGVRVSGTEGLLGRLDFKKSDTYNWDYLNGEWVDLQSRRYASREIVMHCSVKAEPTVSLSAEQVAINKMNAFMKAFDVDRIVRLHIVFVGNNGQSVPISGNSGLFYLVYLAKAGQPDYEWNPHKQIITFDITLREPSPVKRVYKLQATDIGTVKVTVTSPSEVDIHWGDGSVTYDVTGTGVEKVHLYNDIPNKCYIIITGVIKDATTTVAPYQSPEITATLIYDEI